MTAIAQATELQELIQGRLEAARGEAPDPPQAWPCLRGDFDPTRFVDRYEQALREVIARKREGMPVVVAADEVPETNVVNLMDALRRSLGDAGGAPLQKRPSAANRNKPAKPRARPRSGWHDGYPASVAGTLGSVRKPP
ncbi:hypothetical protein SAMN02990966_06846 [Rhodospirillales bacterium URHD0017]|nr:hypothetical protein SAMN02990966_06846 [Rhodospirillales bacterium URHD0017]